MAWYAPDDYRVPSSPPWFAGRSWNRGGVAVREIRRMVVIPNELASARRKRRYAARVKSQGGA